MSKKKRKIEQLAAKPAPMRRVTHRGYTAVQSPRNNHVMIGKAGRMVYHAQYEINLTEDGLRKVIDDYIARSEKVVNRPCVPS